LSSRPSPLIDAGSLVAVLKLALVVFYTALLGSAAIVACLLVPGGALFVPLARVWAWLILRTCRVRLTVARNPALVPSRPCVYVANHQSLFDIPALTLAMPTGFRVVTKRELLFIPIFGWALWLAGFIFIDRSNRERAIRSLGRAAHKIRRGTSIVVFAEGTRRTDGHHMPFKRGGFILALEAGAPIVPVSIQGGAVVLPKGSLRIRPGTIHVTMDAPIDTTAYSSPTRDELIERVRRAIAAGLEAAPIP